jgi:ribose transport system substrate-binding protein
MNTKFLPISLLIVLSLILGACTPAVTSSPDPEVVQATVIVKETVEVEVEVVQQLPAVVVDPAANPYRPNDLFELIAKLQEATQGKSAPADAKYALLTNATTTFWTAAQIGAARASSEVNVPITFQAPTAAEKLSQQLSMLETFINDEYTAITFSAIDRNAAAPIVDKAVANGMVVLCTDSDASGSNRALYIGMSDYDAGMAAGKAALEIVKEGKMVGLVGYATAQNAQDRIAGFKKAIEGSKITLEEVLLDDIKPEVSLSNAQAAMQKYPDLAGFITFYSYNGPTAGQAVKQAGKAGEVKIIAFDAEPDTQRLMEEGVVQAMIGQRVYFYGYLSGYVMHAMSILGVDETLKILEPYLDGEGNYRLNTGVDVIKADTFQLYKDYLNSIGISSQ